MDFPILYHKAKGGDLRQWRVWTDGAWILTEYGQVGGQLQTSKKRAEGKNIGRSNATTPAEQANSEAASLHKHQLERKYSLTKEEAQEELSLPMLAHKYEDKARHVVYPAHVQPKLDGVRCLASRDAKGKISLLSRGGKFYTVPHIQAQLEKWLPGDMMLDGELYLHGASCQTVTSLVKSADPKGKSFKQESEIIEYHVYDMPMFEGDDTLEWQVREGNLRRNLEASKHVLPVEVERVRCEADVWNAHGSYIQDGYEGAILRLYSGLYLWGYRSSELLKVKSFQDGEFEVIGAEQGVGKMSGCVIFVCKNDLTKGEFRVTMKVPMAVRKAMWENKGRYIGQVLTVRFFDRTEDKIPRFPVGIVFRDAKDLPK
jgi:DNA ligase-1